jgi:NADH-quinone oxidoreductase subunit L
MLGPLAILALLSVVGGWIGIGGRFEHFLAPAFQGAGAELARETAETASKAAEYLLMAVSVVAAVLGFLLAWTLYYRSPGVPARIAEGLGGIYRAVANKYYVDELYALLFVKPVVDGSTQILWHGVDESVIDATLNNSADSARHVSDNLRHMQSGNLRSYAGWIAAGGALVIAYMVWMGVR